MEESLRQSLKHIVDIQERDIKMLRLVRVRRERQKELEQIESLRKELKSQLTDKEQEILDLGKQIQAIESKIQEINAKIKKLEGQQGMLKKADEFNALTQEMTGAEREKHALEQRASDLVDRRVAEEEILEKIRESLLISEESSLALEKEIESNIQLINAEGRVLKAERDALSLNANVEILHIYERLFRNKRDRVIVPIESRTCSGCHIVLTAQHENVVRKGENLVFCEHCSRIHYWQEAEVTEGTAASTKRRRRRTATV